MKTTVLFLSLLFLGATMVNSCKKNDSGNTGNLILKGVKSIPVQISANANYSKNTKSGSIVHAMHTANLKVDIADIWVSQDLVTENIRDDFTWYKIGDGNGLKLVEDILMTSGALPIGEYKSVKINFINNIVRIAVYQSDLTKTVEMAESLGESTCGDKSIITLYFSEKGNHHLVNGLFFCDAPGEDIKGFKVNPGETTTIYWKLGGTNSQITDCGFNWFDVNGNNSWDCNIDYVDDFSCAVYAPMWTFGVDDGEVDPVIVNAVSDIDGNSYDGVIIGTQVWMQQNLKTKRLTDGTSLMTREEYKKYLEDHPPLPPPTPLPPSPPLRAIQNNDINLLSICGCLYSWTAVATGKLCPKGWHVPSDSEWTILENFLNKNVGGKLKSMDKMWHSPNEGATNETEFSALPGGAMVLQKWTGPGGVVEKGYRYNGYGESGYWLSSTSGWARILTYSSSGLGREYFQPTGASGDESFLSCRCIRD